MVEFRDVILTRSKNFALRSQQNLKYVEMRIREKITFRPDNAMNSLARGTPDGANRITFGGLFSVTVVAFGFALGE